MIRFIDWYSLMEIPESLHDDFIDIDNHIQSRGHYYIHAKTEFKLMREFMECRRELRREYDKRHRYYIKRKNDIMRTNRYILLNKPYLKHIIISLQVVDKK